MLAKHSFGQANGAAWQYQVPSHDREIEDSISVLARLNEREKKIGQAIAALAKLDDRTLLGLGISHRSHIEWTVRYCHDC